MITDLILLFMLYFIQGIPYGFQTSFIPLVMRKKGSSLTNVYLLRLLFLPWLCKAFLAPVVEARGTRHQWLCSSICGLFLSCLLGCTISPESLSSIGALLFSLNMLVAVQDIVLDGTAITMLSESELGFGNSIQVVAYKCGSIFGGVYLLWLRYYVSFGGVFFVMAGVYGVALTVVYASKSLRTPPPVTVYSIERRIEDSDVIESGSLDRDQVAVHAMTKIANIAIEVVTDAVAMGTYNANNVNNANNQTTTPPIHGDEHTIYEQLELKDKETIANVNASKKNLSMSQMDENMRNNPGDVNINSTTQDLKRHTGGGGGGGVVGAGGVGGIGGGGVGGADGVDLYKDTKNDEMGNITSQRNCSTHSILKSSKPSSDSANNSSDEINQSNASSTSQSKTSSASQSKTSIDKPRRHIEFTSKVDYLEPVQENSDDIINSIIDPQNPSKQPHKPIKDPHNPLKDPHSPSKDSHNLSKDPSDLFIDPLNFPYNNSNEEINCRDDISPQLLKKCASENQIRKRYKETSHLLSESRLNASDQNFHTNTQKSNNTSIYSNLYRSVMSMQISGILGNVPSFIYPTTNRYYESLYSEWIEVIKDIFKICGTGWMIVFVITYKLGESAIINTLPMYLMDHGVQTDHFTFYTSFLGQVVSVIGSILSGVILTQMTVTSLLKILLPLRIPFAIIISIIAYLSTDVDGISYSFINVLIACSVCLQFTSGLITTATFTFMMKLSKQANTSRTQSTHYSMLSTFEILGKLSFVSISGALIDYMGYCGALCVDCLAVMVSLFVFSTRPSPNSTPHLYNR